MSIIACDGTIDDPIPEYDVLATVNEDDGQKNYLVYEYPINESLGYCQSKLLYSLFFLILIFVGSFVYVRVKK